jgi:4,5-DOPA dioxygenase extradiol
MNADRGETMPVLFLSHGAPTLPFDNVPARDFMVRLGGRLPRPKGILCISAHWEAAVPSLTGTKAPDTIHDFYGFPQALYDLTYDAPGDPELAGKAADLLKGAGFAPAIDAERGLDHGVWCPLTLVYPQSGIPVVQLSLLQHQTPARHVALGRALAPLRRDGILILGSGGAVHNLRALNRSGQGVTPDWASAFDRWLSQAIAAGDLDALVAYRQLVPEAEIAHPSEEHIMPLFVALGAASDSAKGAAGKQIHASFTFGSLSMAAFGWDF